MDKRINYLIGVDTETANGLMDGDKLDLSQSLVYDIGWVITDKQGRIYRKRSFIIYEIFCKMLDIMNSAYYAEKIPTYWKEINKGKRKVVTFKTAWNTFRKDMKEYNVKNVFAHNASFDLKALNNTLRYITKSEYRYFFPHETEIWCTLKMARQTIGQQKSYKIYCQNHGFMTNHKIPRPRLTAEILYRYITGNTDFEESHTGLEDVLIETKILVHCFRQHKKMEKRLYA